MRKVCGSGTGSKPYLKFSWIYRVLPNSWWFHVISILLVPAVAFYAVIDEAGNTVFKDIPAVRFLDEAYLIVEGFMFSWTGYFSKKAFKYNTCLSLNVCPISDTFNLFLNNSFFTYYWVLTASEWLHSMFSVFFILNSFFDDNVIKYILTLRLLVYTGGFMGIHWIIPVY